MITPTFSSRSFKGRCYDNRFLARISESWHTSPIFCALAFHNGWEDRNTDTRDNMATSNINLVKFGLVTLAFCRCVCAGRATRWALPRGHRRDKLDSVRPRGRPQKSSIARLRRQPRTSSAASCNCRSVFCNSQSYYKRRPTCGLVLSIHCIISVI